jgi:MerR family transcriptional regulator/heat shock protein HspR
VISVAAGMVHAHPRTLRIYEDEGLLAPARTPTNIRLYSENDIRWIRRLTQERGVNLAGVRLLFEIEERLGTRILEALFDEAQARQARAAAAALQDQPGDASDSTDHQTAEVAPEGPFSDDSATSRTTEQAAPAGFPVRQPITRIVATRVTTTRSGDSND